MQKITSSLKLRSSVFFGEKTQCLIFGGNGSISKCLCATDCVANYLFCGSEHMVTPGECQVHQPLPQLVKHSWSTCVPQHCSIVTINGAKRNFSQHSSAAPSEEKKVMLSKTILSFSCIITQVAPQTVHNTMQSPCVPYNTDFAVICGILWNVISLSSLSTYCCPAEEERTRCRTLHMASHIDHMRSPQYTWKNIMEKYI